jgi:hypothetical protein
MAFQLFCDPPSVELLQWLARGSLKQNLLRAVRLWVWLRVLYGDETEQLDLNDPFTYAQWREAFFSTTHPKGEEVPHHKDPHCLCNKRAADWLFGGGRDIEQLNWELAMEQHAGINNEELAVLLDKPLFAMTRRMLSEDLQALKKLQWLEYEGRKYHRVQLWPNRPSATRELNFLNPDLATIASNHSDRINGIQRFFLHTDDLNYPTLRCTTCERDYFSGKISPMHATNSFAIAKSIKEF